MDADEDTDGENDAAEAAAESACCGVRNEGTENTSGVATAGAAGSSRDNDASSSGNNRDAACDQQGGVGASKVDNDTDMESSALSMPDGNASDTQPVLGDDSGLPSIAEHQGDEGDDGPAPTDATGTADGEDATEAGDIDGNDASQALTSAREERHCRIEGLSETELETVSCKIVDFGNACWRQRHFTDDIQTRQYRSPEVIVGQGYDTSTDLWSFACMIFELVTGVYQSDVVAVNVLVFKHSHLDHNDVVWKPLMCVCHRVITHVGCVAGDLLFDPREARDRSYSRDEDHLALMMELLGQMPVSMTLRGKNTPRFFEREGRYLKRIKQLNYWPLGHVLVEKYDMDPAEVRTSVILVVACAQSGFTCVRVLAILFGTKKFVPVCCRLRD